MPSKFLRFSQIDPASQALQGGSCEYANAAHGGLQRLGRSRIVFGNSAEKLGGPCCKDLKELFVRQLLGSVVFEQFYP